MRRADKRHSDHSTDPLRGEHRHCGVRSDNDFPGEGRAKQNPQVSRKAPIGDP